MSEKRQRQQQRRQRRKAQGAARPRTRAHSPDRLLATAARLATDAISDVSTALEAEQWASALIGTWRERGDEADAIFFPGLVRALEVLGTARALASLRALGMIGEGARASADRLAASGVVEPLWADSLGGARPTVAAILEEPAFDDGATVVLEFDDALTLGIYIDHNLGGLVKDAFVSMPIAELTLPAEIVVRDLDLAEARARVDRALWVLDHTLTPPISEDVGALRAMIDARLSLLPSGFELPDTDAPMPFEERDVLQDEFMASLAGRRWTGDAEAEDIVRLAIDFGADYNHDGPLRWSPVVVELFMTDWLPRKVLADREYFARVPDVLTSLVRYAGWRRGVPVNMIREAIATVEACRDELLDAAGDRATWGPAKIFEAAAREAGVDLTDPESIDAFVERFNAGRAA